MKECESALSLSETVRNLSPYKKRALTREAFVTGVTAAQPVTGVTVASSPLSRPYRHLYQSYHRYCFPCFGDTTMDVSRQPAASMSIVQPCGRHAPAGPAPARPPHRDESATRRRHYGASALNTAQRRRRCFLASVSASPARRRVLMSARGRGGSHSDTETPRGLPREGAARCAASPRGKAVREPRERAIAQLVMM